MGDRNNPIKFGPEWLRNMSRERSAARSTNNQNSNSGPATASAGPSGASGGAAANIGGSTATTNSSGTSKILLAKLRYGREEMLALYDRNAEAPPELKVIDTLYQPRGKQPVALNSTFEDDMRDSLRSVPSIGGMSSADRFGLSRGAGRGGVSDGRARTRGSAPRFTPLTGRGGAHYMPKVGTPRMPYSGGDDDGGPTRPWSNNVLNATNRNSGDQADWASKMYRSKRQGNNTNWRQPQTRDEGEEWRSSEPGRSRPLEKWDRDWGDRQSGEKPQSWNANRRTWVGGDSQNEENLPEWAAENAECGGTFDSSGAFHGYSNDDTNLPKHQDSSYPLTRSHTHGSFPRSKTVEEGSDEWWASEKAKKLSPKRFDASDIKFKKQSSVTMGDVGNSSSSTNNKSNTSKEDASQEVHEKSESSATAPEPPESNNAQADDKYSNQNMFKSKFVESKTFDAMMRSDINVEEASDERGNFQSVIITPNNSLRQKHQHMVLAADGQKHIRISMKGNNKPEMDHGTLKSSEDMLVDNIFGMSIDDDEILSSTLSNPGISSEMASGGPGLSQNPNQNIQMSMSNSALGGLSGRAMDMHVNKQNMQGSGFPSGHPMSGMQPNILTSPGLQKVSGVPIQPGGHMQGSGMPSGPMQTSVMSNPMGAVGLQNPGGMSNSGLQSSGMQAPRVQTPGMQSVMQPAMQPVGITNSALNASLGLPMVPGGNMQGVPQQVMPNVCMANSMSATGMGVMGSSSMQGPGNMSSYHSGSGLQGMSSNNVGNNSLFLGKNSNNPSMSTANEMPMSNHVGQSNMFPMHGLQHSGSQASFGNSIYSNNQNLSDQWYYEDPERNIQGPFPSKDMYNWYRAGFFSARLMVRRACETSMRPLGSYGPVVPFAQMDMMPGFPMSGGFESRPQGNHESMLNSQPSLGLDVMNMGNINRSENPQMEPLQFGSVGRMPNQSFGQPPQRVESLWGQPSTSSDLMWMQQPAPRSEARVNNLPLYFWDQQPSAITSKSLLPEDITKEMKTEDQILAQLRATQPLGQSGLQYLSEPPPPVPPPAPKTSEDSYPPLQNTTPDLEELQKLIQKDTLTGISTGVTESDNESQMKVEKATKLDQSSSETSVSKQAQNKSPVDTKATKTAKDTEKSTKNKENNNTKNKTKKSKEDKKEEVEIKSKEEEVIKAEKRSQEPSPAKSKKEEKSKKELEREKKEWLKDGFTIVKGPEKSVSKDNKKKAEELRAAEEAEKKKKEDEKLAAEEDKKKKLAESAKNLKEQQAQQRQSSETVAKKAPWSAVATQAMQATTRDGLTLSDIQRLEREKKLEQMKEQQQMMQIIAQQQAAALAREQEMQAGLGWAKKKNNNANVPGQSLTEIQAEARKQAAAAAAAAAAQALDEAQAAAAAAPPLVNHVPWANAINGGFWETQLENQKLAKQEAAKEKVEPIKPKKKPTVVIPPKKEPTPAVEFENWCNSVLTSWSSKIDVPTFVGFLKDIESPYEVKDYVKCYLGESKDSSDFARQFLERRSKLLRVGMVTPSDDLCSPAIAVNPRTISGSDFQEVKGKGKKTKKNKMLKVDARILGFSVTASEDRINVGDIDTV